MKNLLFIVAILATTTQEGFSQDSATQSQKPQILSFYYNIKNALVVGNAIVAANNAEAFVKAANDISSKSIPKSNISTLVEDAAAISASKDLNEQRTRFAVLSTNLFAIVKTIKLTDEPVYEAYCPMKKAYWLSSDKAIKNPYYGSAMLTCGKIVETINP